MLIVLSYPFIRKVDELDKSKNGAPGPLPGIDVLELSSSSSPSFFLKTLPSVTSSKITTVATGPILGILVALSPWYYPLVISTTYVKGHRPQGQNKVSVLTILSVPTRPTCAAWHI